MIDEQFEFRLSQYLDGTLPVDEAAAFFDELSKNPAALVLLDEYRKLDMILKAQPADAINWNGLAEDIGAQIDKDSRLRLRAWSIAPLRLAIAASVLLAVGIAGWIALRNTTTGPAAPAAVARITGPAAEVASAAPVSRIEIGPESTAVAEQTITYHYAELMPRPARVVIASGVEARQDERLMPF